MTPARFLNVLRRRWIVVFGTLAVGLALVFALRNLVPNSYIGQSHVVLVADSGGRDPSVGIVDLPAIATSTVVLERVRNSLKLPISLIDFKLAVGAAVLGRSSILAISYRSEQADEAIAVANALAETLSRYYDEISTRRYDVNVDRITSELGTSAASIHAIQQRLAAIVARNPYVVSDQSISALTTNLATLNADRAVAYATLEGDRAILDTLAPGQGISETARHEILSGDATYKAVNNVLAQDSAQLGVIEAGYTAAFPGLPGAIAKVGSEKALADRVAERALADPHAFSPSAAGTVALRVHQKAVVDGDISHVQQLDALITQEGGTLRGYPDSARAYNQLAAERDALQTEYAALATRRANALANRAEASSLGSVVVLDRAIKADTQLAGGRLRAAILATILLLAFAIGAAFMAEKFDPRIRRAEEIEELYGMPVVARFGAKV